MFAPKTERIAKLAGLFPDVVAELDRIFTAPTNIYIDWQNVIHWQDRLGWHFDAKRLKQFLANASVSAVSFVVTYLVCELLFFRFMLPSMFERLLTPAGWYDLRRGCSISLGRVLVGIVNAGLGGQRECGSGGFDSV